VFAFGALLFELVTGRAAFRRGTVIDTLTAVVGDAPPPLDAVAPGAPPAVARVVARCLSKEPADRYADGAALCAAGRE
jgi:hypothetical protein